MHRLLDRYDVRRYALFVVPDWHGSWPLRQHRGFAADLRRRQGDGCEIFVHGYRHDEVGVGRSAWHHLRAIGRTAREAEFLSLSAAEAGERVERGRRVLREVGLEPVGFVPPAWFHGAGLSQVLADCGLAFTEDAWAVRSVASGRRVRASAVRWSTRARHRALAGVAIARLRRPADRWRPVIRLAIHPPDIEHPLVARSLERVLAELLAERSAVSYADVVGDA